MKRTSYNCDICGVERKEANHWFVATKDAVCFSIEAWDAAEIENDLDSMNAIHLCGQVCAHKLLDRFLVETSTTSTKGENNGEKQFV
jgi:hypothetical protein